MRTGSEDLSRRQRACYGFLGLVLLLVIWQIVGAKSLAGHTVPSATQVFTVYAIPWRRSLLLRSMRATLFSASIGLVLGLFVGLLTAFVASLINPLRPGLDKLAIAANAVPAIALGPILIITVGREMTPILLAAIGVAFLTYVAISSGIRASDSQVGRMFSATGASRWRTLLHLQVPLAIPALVSTMKIAVTTAVIGAVVGEWFGSFSGLGIVILNTMQNFQIPLMWAAVLMLVATSVAGYGAFTLLEVIVRKRYQQ